MKKRPAQGITRLGNGRCRFCVWAPFAGKVELHVLSPEERIIPLRAQKGGYYERTVENIPFGTLYKYRLDGKKERPDPSSRFQPQGVHGPSEVVNPYFKWNDEGWHGLPLQQYIIYELHVGLFSPEGTFDGVIRRIGFLKKLGVTAIELMPVAQFPGRRNWGYDGVYPFAVQNSYGNPASFKKLVDVCHRNQMAVILDVVYNHVGPEGNYLADYGPYFTDRRTRWGPAVNFDGMSSGDVRWFFIENALYWITEFHIDALRLDAVHAITDTSARPFLADLASFVHRDAKRTKRRVFLIAESVLNDTKVISPKDQGGWGLDAQWNDDFHHALHALLTGEQTGYYVDFGSLDDLAKAFREGFVYSGDYSTFRKARHGASSREIPGHRLVVFSQNHDQVGNRMLGERLSSLVSYEALKLAAGTVLLSPYIPLLFMGEESGEVSPFLYFIDHSDPDLVEAVKRGRKEEFAAFHWPANPPDPHALRTFDPCRLQWKDRQKRYSRVLLSFYRQLIRLRKEIPALCHLNKRDMAVSKSQEHLLIVRRWHRKSSVCLLMNFHAGATASRVDLGQGKWQKILDSSETRWVGPGSLMPRLLSGDQWIEINPWSFSVYQK